MYKLFAVCYLAHCVKEMLEIYVPWDRNNKFGYLFCIIAYTYLILF